MEVQALHEQFFKRCSGRHGYYFAMVLAYVGIGVLSINQTLNGQQLEFMHVHAIGNMCMHVKKHVTGQATV